MTEEKETEPETHSHLFGNEILDAKYPYTVQEIVAIPTTTTVPLPS